MPSKVAGYIATISGAVVLGMWATAGKVALATIPPLTIAVFVQAVPSAVFAPWLGRLRLSRRAWGYTVLASLAGSVVAPIVYFVGLVRTTPPDAALLSNTEAMFTVVLAFAVLGERLTRRGYVAVAAILAGAVLVTLNVSAAGPEFVSRVVGDALLLLSAALWGVDNVLSRIVTRDHDLRAYVCVKMGFGSILLAPIAVAFGQPLSIAPSSLPMAAFLALAGSAAFAVLFLFAMRAIGALRVGAILGTSAAWGVGIAVAVGFPPPTPLQLVGGAIMVGAILLLYLQPQVPSAAVGAASRAAPGVSGKAK